MRISTTATQRFKILALLQTKGSATNIELNRICYRYSARLHELRQEGHQIATVGGKDRIFTYVYRGRGQS